MSSVLRVPSVGAAIEHACSILDRIAPESLSVPERGSGLKSLHRGGRNRHADSCNSALNWWCVFRSCFPTTRCRSGARTSAAPLPPAAAPTLAAVDGGDGAGPQLVRQAKLNAMRYERNAPRRRAVLARLFRAMSDRESFTLGEVHESMHEAGEPTALAFGDLVKYARTLYLGGALTPEEDQDEVFFRDRRMSLTLDPLVAESLVLAYETAVATRVVAVAGETTVDTAAVCAVLGLDPASPDDLRYCSGVLDAAKRRAAASAAQRSA